MIGLPPQRSFWEDVFGFDPINPPHHLLHDPIGQRLLHAALQRAKWQGRRAAEVTIWAASPTGLAWREWEHIAKEMV